MYRMMKSVLIALAVIVVLAIAVVGYVAATFDPAQYKPQLVQMIKEKTRRTLKIDGDVRLSFFPDIGAEISKLSLSEPESDKEFIGAEAARVSLKLLPLLSRQVVVDAVDLKGVRADVVRDKTGKFNFENLIGGPEGKSTENITPSKPPGGAVAPNPAGSGAGAFPIEIGGIVVDGATVNYTDEATGFRYTLSDVKLETGRIANGSPGKAQLKFAVKSEKASLDCAANLRTRFLFDETKEHYQLEGLELTLKGAVPGISNLNATVKGDAQARSATGEILLSKVSISAMGKREGGELNVKLELPKLSVTKDKVSGDKATFEALMSDAKGKVTARLEVPGVDGTPKSFATGEITGAVETQEEGRRMNGKLAAKLTGNLELKRYELSKFQATVSINDSKLPTNPMEALIDGSALIDLNNETATVDWTTKFDESSITGKAGISGFASPVYTFDVSIDQLDADRYLATQESSGAGSGQAAKGGAAASGKTTVKPLDLSALEGLTATGSVRVGRLKAANVRSEQVSAEMKAENGKLDVTALTASLYGGSLSGTLSVRSGPSPTFVLKNKLSGVSVAPLLRDAANYDSLEGRGTFSVDITSQGATASALKKAVNGTAALNVTDGALKGIDLAGTIRNAKSRLKELGGQKTQSANKGEKTDFSELKGSFQIKNGVARNNDLSAKSPLLRLTGEGDIDIGNDTLNYLVRATVVATTKGQGGHDLADLSGVTVPVKLTGAINDPKYTIDFASLATEILKKEQEGVMGGLKDKVGKPVQDRVKGLLGR